MQERVGLLELQVVISDQYYYWLNDVNFNKLFGRVEAREVKYSDQIYVRLADEKTLSVIYLRYFGISGKWEFSSVG